MRLKHFILLFFAITSFAFSYGQHTAHHAFHKHHMLSVIVSHTQVSQGIDASGDRKWLSLPSWAINYNYKFSPKWAIGLHNDIIVETFEVKEHLKSGTSATIERKYPVASVAVASYKPGKNFSYLLGAGGEFAHGKNFFLIRVGVDYGYHFHKNWELNVSLVNDLKVKAYNSWGFGMGVTRIF